MHRARGSRLKLIPRRAPAYLRSESPIEETLIANILSWIDHHGASATVSTQVPVGPYRADILIETGGRSMVVECDGAKFHNGAEQIEHDKRRDRYCALNDIAVMRFTGAEITRDPRRCSAEVGLWIMKR